MAFNVPVYPSPENLYSALCWWLLIMAMALVLLTLSVLGIAGLAGYAKYNQTLKIERARQLMATMEKAKRSLGALETLPKSYLKPNLRRYLVSSWYNAQKAYIEACPEPSSRELKQLEQAQQAKESFNEADALNESRPEFSSPDQAKDVRSLLKNLHLQIKEDYSEKHLNKNQAMALLNEIKTILDQLGVDFHLSIARTAERSGDLSKALSGYRSALAARKKAGRRLQQESLDQWLEEQISTLTSQIHEQQQLRQDATKQTLERGLNDTDGTFTPKKQNYD